uniref:F-box associated domain-containing protein n=1 Tax=Arundo donax TaxID=35708 RepID=A0A0A9F631_ARUDO
MATDDDDELVKATMYSSATCAWSTPVTLDNGCESYVQHRRDAHNSEYHRFYYTPYVQPRRVALVADEIYFTLRWGNAIVKYNWVKNCISMIKPPPHNSYNIALMLMEDNSLGFACIEDSSLYLWSRKVNSEGAAEWVQCRVIELKTMIPAADPDDKAYVVGSAEGVGVIFVSTGVGLFTIKLNSGQIKKVEEPEVYFSVLPYMSFYTPDCGTSSSLARPRTH